MADKPKTPKADALAAKIKRARQRADRLPGRRHEAEGVLLELAEHEQRMASLRGGTRAETLAARAKPNGGGPQ